MISPGEAVVAGVSGGADSLCLFRVLVRMSGEMGFLLQVVHVHHGLRESAREDLEFVQELCRRENVPCRCVMADAAGMAARWGTGVEEAGRRLRYAAFEETRARLEAETGRPCRIAVAHHREDQAETVLFHLCRGTDLRGARGMLPVSGHIVRPLLRETRADIEAFLTSQGMTWREDETNEDTSYTRNFLRREILPRLKESVNPASAENLARFAGACAETERFLEAETEKAAQRCITGFSEKTGASSAANLSDGNLPGSNQQTPDGNLPGGNQQIPYEDQPGGNLQTTDEGGNGVPGGCLNPSDEGAYRRITLSLEALRKEDPLIQGRILYRCLAACAGRRKDLSSVHVDAMRELCDGERDGSLSLPGRVTLLRAGGILYFYKKTALSSEKKGESAGGGKPVRADGSSSGALLAQELRSRGAALPLSEEEYECRVFSFDGDLSAIPQNEYTKWFDYAKIGMFPVFRKRRAGDRMTLLAEGREGGLISKKLARIMLDGKIPSQVRAELLLPFCGSEALWIPGLRMGDRYRVTPETATVLEISWRDQKDPQ